MEEHTGPDFITHFVGILRALVHEPDLLRVLISDETDGSTTIAVGAPERDMRRLVGLGGRTAKALRTLLFRVRPPEGGRYVLDLKDSV